MRTLTGTMALVGAAATAAAAEPQAASHAAASPWTGFYAGFSAGALFDESHLDAHHGNFIQPIPYSKHIGETDFLPGVQAGYNSQLPSGVVLGGEADFSYPDSNGVFTFRNAFGAFDKFSVKNKRQGSVRARLGYALDNLLPYMTAGVSFADARLRYSNEAGEVVAKDEVQAGWVLGGGLEYAVQENLSVRGEYLYTDYGAPLSMGIRRIVGVVDSSGVAKADLVTHTLRAALNYRF